MYTYKLYIDAQTMKSKENVRKILTFCSTACNKLTLSVLLNSYNLKAEEYQKAFEDISELYMKENLKRREEYDSKEEYRASLLNRYYTEEAVLEYLDRLYLYDKIYLKEIEKVLKQYVEDSKNRKKDTVGSRLLKEQYVKSWFTVYSHCTTGGIWKVYDFTLNNTLICDLYDEGDLFRLYKIDGTDNLEDPAFYWNDTLIISICSHEEKTFLFLNEEQYASFRRLEVPYRIA